MYHILVPNRPVHQCHQALSSSPTRLLFAIPARPAFSNFAVFQDPSQSLPAGTIAAVYIQLPARPAPPLAQQQPHQLLNQPEPEYIPLGFLSPAKQSAFFKLDLRSATSSSAADPAQPELIHIGISLEPEARLPDLTREIAAAAAGTTTTTTTTTTTSAPIPPQAKRTLLRRIAAHALNFVHSFPDGSASLLPARAVEDWWRRFEKRVELDPAILDRDVD